MTEVCGSCGTHVGDPREHRMICIGYMRHRLTWREEVIGILWCITITGVIILISILL